MSKAEIKSAMESLQVHKPFRMPARAPAFTPPPCDPEIQTLVENQTQDENPTLVEKKTKVENTTPSLNSTPVMIQPVEEMKTQVSQSTKVEDNTQVANPTGVGKDTVAVKSTKEEKATQVAESTVALNKTVVKINTSVENKTQVGNHDLGEVNDSATLTRRATEQDSSVVLEARAADGLEKGYTRVPNSILMKLVGGDFTRNEIKLALLIARFTISFQRKLAPLSKAVLERRSGLRGPAVLEAISGLVSKGLIEKLKGDQHRPNMLGLVLPADWDELLKTKREVDGTSVGNPTQVGIVTPASTQTSPEGAKQTGAGVENPTHFKDIKTIKNINSLSQLPDVLQKYFVDLKPAKKRESEWKAFESLTIDYSLEDISECLGDVTQRGVGQGADSMRCHSPMAFLSKAMAELLPEVKARRKKIEDRLMRESAESESAKKRAAEEVREAEEWAAKERAFKKTFPGEERQSEVLAELLQGMPFGPNSQAGRNLAITRWWDKLSQSEKMDFL